MCNKCNKQVEIEKCKVCGHKCNKPIDLCDELGKTVRMQTIKLHQKQKVLGDLLEFVKGKNLLEEYVSL